jgi:hypothetical protein
MRAVQNAFQEAGSEDRDGEVLFDRVLHEDCLQVPSTLGSEGSVLSTDSFLPAPQEPAVELGAIVSWAAGREVVLGDALACGNYLERLDRLAPEVLGGLFSMLFMDLGKQPSRETNFSSAARVCAVRNLQSLLLLRSNCGQTARIGMMRKPEKIRKPHICRTFCGALGRTRTCDLLCS